MSVQATSWVLRDGPRMSDVDRDGKRYGTRARGYRAVLFTIADAANRDGEHAHPGLAAIVEGALYSKAQVIRITNELVAEGWLDIVEEGRGRGKATVYTVCFDRRSPGKVAPCDLSTDDESVAPGCDLSDDENGRTMRPIEDGKGRISAEKRSHTDVEKVAYGDRAPITQQDPTSTQHSGAVAPKAKATDDPLVARAHLLTTLAFEQIPRPTLRHEGGSAFAAVLALIVDLLDAGHDDDIVADAIRAGEVHAWTKNGLLVAVMRRRRGRSGGATVEDLRSARERAAQRDAEAAAS